ncbi:N-lysine methyltransferase KMT5A-A, partial [Clarias magur]
MTSSKNPPTPEQETADNKASKKMSALPSDSAACEELIGVSDETPSELQHSTHEVNTTSQSDVRAEVEESVMESSVCAHAKTLEKVTLDMGQFSSEKQTYVEKKGGEKTSPVKEWLVNEELSFCSSTQGLEQMTSSKNPPTPEQETADDEASKKDCDHDVVISTISSIDKCAACVGPVVSFKWIGLRCRCSVLQLLAQVLLSQASWFETIIIDGISVTDSEASGSDESDAEDDVSADAANNVGIQKLPTETTAEVSQGKETKIRNPRKGQRVSWSNVEVTAVMKHFKAHVTKGKLATLTECQQCKTTEDPVLAQRTAQNIRDFQAVMPPWISPLKDAIHHIVSKTDKTWKLEVKYINVEKASIAANAMVGGRLPAFPPGKVSDRRRYWSKQHSSTGKVTQRKKTPWQQTEKKWIKVRKKAK